MKQGNFKQEEKSILEMRLKFEALSVYRDILKDKVINKLYSLVDYLYVGECDLCGFLSHYNNFYNSLMEENPSGSLKNYIIDYIIYNENPFSRKAEFTNIKEIEDSYKNVVKEDLNFLQNISNLSSSFLKNYAVKHFSQWDFEETIIRNLPKWKVSAKFSGHESYKRTAEKLVTSSLWGDYLEVLGDFYKENGTGIFAKHRGFVWEAQGNEKYLKGIDSPDPIMLKNLIGYERERKQIIENTMHFLNGHTANNILLYGDRGTGKSSTVKALLNEYHTMGLRIIEIPKQYLPDLPEIIRAVKNRNLYFIFFIDDLAFEDSEESYTALKAILEGGLESRPENVVIYATSNRRHLIKEKFSERQGLMSGNYEDEVHAGDTMQEKLSLADRFGITITFTSPDQNKYLDIVDGLALQRNIEMDEETLHRKALQWEMRHNGRSARTARQFIDWLEGEIKMKEVLS
ncbi:ATPase family associated with various cellular activities (AAA) [Clostridium homopropionicum DSM 5847]|uniref:ATPase family associated with various cellular activities (AAA) n=1 Tax=Clostridium homopropionicum DSM 5847 TaxID=1121318 RepID=A0A0L6ZC94_9CLOT|nr:ATP-binding protein [Clostridium homopropionicum]KOA20418.1 ATPase family associated with various cellular activities (AAA) [Clostridium homopropionicum DSM 5847]SFG34258.1 hypothetical protein SAMN04488501_10810 [Clostridium homopropionicum]